MAIELVRVVWCDICLKRDKVQTPGEEAVATVVDPTYNKLKKIDLCEVHRKELAYDDIIEFGGLIEKPLSAMSSRGRKPPSRVVITDPVPAPEHRDPTRYTSGGQLRTDRRRIGNCSRCGKVLSEGAITLHNKAHANRGEKPGKWLPQDE